MKDLILKLNLQLFAEGDATGGYDRNVMGTYTGTGEASGTNDRDLSPEMKVYYDNRLLKLAEPNLVFNQFGRKTSIPKNGGKTIEYRMFSSFPKATTPLTEGVTPAGVPMKVTTLTKTLDEYGAYTTLTDTLQLTAIDNNITQATEKHAESMALTLNAITRTELCSAHNVYYASNVSGVQAQEDADITTAHKITYADIAKLATMLKRNNAPKIDGKYIFIVHPDVSLDLQLDEHWIDVQKYKNPERIYNGEIGTLHDFRFIESTEVLVELAGASGVAVYNNIVLGKDAYDVLDVAGLGAEIIVKPAGSSGTADPLNQRSTVGWKIPMYGAKITIQQYIFNYVCGSSIGDTALAN